VEQANVTSLFEQPLHPYTRGLISSIPVLGESKHRLDIIEGNVPNLIDLPPGCSFAPRCQAHKDHNLTICVMKNPDLLPVGNDHSVQCWLYHDDDGHEVPLKIL
jgi:oligopeptide/dipeptide ABC transporter ATP-binding protein